MLTAFITKIRNHYSAISNLRSAIQVLSCIAYIERELTDPNKIEANGEQAIINRAVSEDMLRNPDGTAIHVAHLRTSAEAKTYFENLISQMKQAIISLEQLSKQNNQIDYLPSFLLNIRDSDVGCMEMRVKQALDFVGLLNSNGGILSLQDTMHQFISQLAVSVDQACDEAVFHAALSYFNHYINHNYPFYYQEKVQALDWTLVISYLCNVLNYDESRFIEVRRFLQFPRHTHVETRRNQVWAVLQFECEEDATLFAGYIKALLPADFAEDLNKIRITQDRSGLFKFRLSKEQNDFLHALLQMRLIKPAAPIRSEDIYLLKVVRFDNMGYIKQFCNMMTPSNERKEKIELRLGKKKEYTVTGHGVFARNGKAPAYTPEQKQYYSHYSSTTLATPDIQPMLFGSSKRARSLVGFYFQLETHHQVNALLGRMFIYDGGTVGRPYDFATEIDATNYFVKKVLNNNPKLFANLLDLIEALKNPANKNSYSEILARLRWAMDNSCGVLIASDTLESRLMAYEYARLMRSYLRSQFRETGRAWPAEYRVPIRFYRPGYNRNVLQEEYLDEDYAKDRSEANRIFYAENPAEKNALYQAFEFSFLLAIENDDDIINELFLHEIIKNDYRVCLLIYILDLRRYHVIDLLLEKHPKLAVFDFSDQVKTKILSLKNIFLKAINEIAYLFSGSRRDSFVLFMILDQAVQDNQVTIIDWFLRMDFGLDLSNIFPEKLYNTNEFRFDDLNMLTYLLSNINKPIRTGHLNMYGQDRNLTKALTAAIKSHHESFIVALFSIPESYISPILFKWGLPRETQINAIAAKKDATLLDKLISFLLNHSSLRSWTLMQRNLISKCLFSSNPANAMIMAEEFNLERYNDDSTLSLLETDYTSCQNTEAVLRLFTRVLVHSNDVFRFSYPDKTLSYLAFFLNQAVARGNNEFIKALKSKKELLLKCLRKRYHTHDLWHQLDTIESDTDIALVTPRLKR